jgi:ureidoglycolate lyase
MRDITIRAKASPETDVPVTVQACAITVEAFAPYGDLLDPPAHIGRFNFVTDIESRRPQARLNVALVRCAAVPSRLRIDEMECHRFSAQAFFPLDVSEYLVVVACDDGSGKPDPKTIAAFRVSHHHGINYHAGTWHIGMGTISQAGTFALLVHEDGSPDDCWFHPIKPFDVLVRSEDLAGSN